MTEAKVLAKLVFYICAPFLAVILVDRLWGLPIWLLVPALAAATPGVMLIKAEELDQDILLLEARAGGEKGGLTLHENTVVEYKEL